MSIANLPLDARNVINGTHGTVYINNSIKVAEVTKFNAKIAFERSDVNMAGTLSKGSKLTGYSISGELTINHVRDLLVKEVIENLSKGKDTYISFTSKVADPDSFGTEAYVITGAVLTELVLADWEVGKLGERSYPFTATDVDIISTVEHNFG